MMKRNIEREENIMKYIYEKWHIGKMPTIYTLKEWLAADADELQILIQSLENHGYIETTTDEEIFLTSLGKAQGAELLERHRGLTQFIQTVCDVSIEEASENACRVEHVISESVVKGFYDFVRFGNQYEREVTNTNLHLKYKVGSYRFIMGIYMAERRFPRVLSRENKIFANEVELQVTKEQSYFYMKKKEEFNKNVWYLCNGNWELANVTSKGIQIPSMAFRFVVDVNEPIIEGNVIVAFSASNEEPRSDYRELNIHMW